MQQRSGIGDAGSRGLMLPEETTTDPRCGPWTNRSLRVANGCDCFPALGGRRSRRGGPRDEEETKDGVAAGELASLPHHPSDERT